MDFQTAKSTFDGAKATFGLANELVKAMEKIDVRIGKTTFYVGIGTVLGTVGIGLGLAWLWVRFYLSTAYIKWV
jgi:ABC-type Fe3+ transport system permease subunit